MRSPRGRMGVEFGVEVVGVLGGAQGRLGAVFRTLANEFGIAPLRVAAFNRAPQHGVAGVDVVVPELGSLVVGVDADHDVSCHDDPSRVDSTPIFQARQPFAEFRRSSSAGLDLLDSPLIAGMPRSGRSRATAVGRTQRYQRSASMPLDFGRLLPVGEISELMGPRSTHWRRSPRLIPGPKADNGR